MSEKSRRRSGGERGRQPSVKDVAERAGVSSMTVSNVVNGRTNVRPATREKVEQAISELGYRTSLAGRQLRAGRTKILAVALPKLTTPYFASLAHEIITAAEELEYTVLIAETTSSPERERHAARGFTTQFADGIILRPDSLDGAGVLDSHGPMPLVLLGERVEGSHLDHVMIDNAQSGRDATEHILSLGCTSPLFLGAHEDKQFGPGWVRSLGFRSALKDAGLPSGPDRLVRVSPYGRAAAVDTVHELLRAGIEFDSLVCATDLIAVGAMYALRRSGLSVPGDVAVLGWDGTLEGEYANPSLTTVAVDIPRVAREAVATLVRRVEDPDAPPTDVVVEQTIIIRESTTGVLAVPAGESANG
ncbi:LacI family DNA-binding transcriptional regulator [Brachybacterium sacelli]|uniref:DNA-binding LacI/PurR family transcriptional regulator n=1 Tax=Brachybacterium sacelli TaxID=173364 RepID=A0ABS4X197_9MICO|nr:LacI family DNA-binding transcriptional regulator [Brachybacterium sacelli]MBP2381504.1 DNA-binding LacI/PurR family transcriptional regulator [Brachybacterium sacelli]